MPAAPKKKDHSITIEDVRLGKPDAVITCSCGWTTKVPNQGTVSFSVQDAILYHRVEAIEKKLGIEIEILYGKKA